jgi:hypothetical protein
MTSPSLPPLITGDAARRTIPFDYSFQYELEGQGKVLKKSVDVSVEAAFTAVSIGYGVIPQIQSIEFGPDIEELPSGLLAGSGIAVAASPTIAGLPLGDIPLSTLIRAADRVFANLPELERGRPASDAVLLQGIRLNPALAHLALQKGPLPDRVLSRLFRLAGSGTSEIQFLYALTDEGTGRSFQSEPILNTAGLGISNGDRPFRHFVPPITFVPRSKISLEITEVSNFVGKLHVSLQGYKVLGAADSPTGRVWSGVRHVPASRRHR